MKDIKLETQRLFIYSITDEEIKNKIKSEENEELKKAYNQMLEGCLENPEKRIWYTMWNIELKNEKVIGSLGFKGLNDDGMIEVGYGIDEPYRNNGYMTEALKEVSKWAINQEEVTRIEAEIEITNIPSKRVLEKSSYAPNNEIGEEGPRYVYMGK